MERVDDDPDDLTGPEVDRALTELGPADWKRVERFADARARGLRGASGEDLVGEACVQLLARQRRFPRGKRTWVVLTNAIRGIASNVRKSVWEKNRDEGVAIEPECDPDATESFEDSRSVADRAVDRTTPEAELLAKEQLDALWASLADDHEAQLVAMAWADGLRGADGIAATGLAASVYDAARKRLLRKRDAAERLGEKP